MENFKSLKRRLERIEEVLSPTEEEASATVVIYVPGTDQQPLPGYEQATAGRGMRIFIPDNSRDHYAERYTG